MSSRKTAFAMAKQYRTCPPPGVFNNPHQRDNVQKHLAVCPHCADRVGESAAPLEMWETMAEKIKETSPISETKERATDKRIGHLCPVCTASGFWHNGLYYNPPCVLILDFNEAYPEAVQVVQTYHDLSMAAPGDLILFDEQSACGECFVEPWNLYTLQIADLDSPVGRVSEDVIAWIRRMADDPAALPDWAIAPKPLTAHDPRTYFRELEATVGYRFASRAVSELIQYSEKPPVKLIYASTEDLIADMRKKIPGIRWPAEPTAEGIAFAAAKLPPEYYSQAADNEGGERIPVNLFAIRSGRLLHTTSATAEVMRRDQNGMVGEIAGRIRSLPETVRDSDMYCHLYSEETGYIMPNTVDWQESTGYFTVRFDAVGSVLMNLYIGIIYDLDTL